MKIYVINGYPGSGKDEFVKFCKEFYPNTKNITTSDPVKKAFKLLGWKGIKTPEVRRAMAEVKNMSDIFFDTSFNHVCSELNKGVVRNALVFIHVREPINIQRYVNTLGADTILLMRDEHEKCSNHSDLNVECYNYTHKIDNNGSLKELREKAREFVNVYVRGERYELYSN